MFAILTHNKTLFNQFSDAIITLINTVTAETEG